MGEDQNYQNKSWTLQPLDQLCRKVLSNFKQQQLKCWPRAGSAERIFLAAVKHILNRTDTL